jgi:hypothetical protein
MATKDLGDLLKRNGAGKELGELLAPKSSGPQALEKLLVPKSASARLQKRRVMRRLTKFVAPKDTFEDLIAQVREPAIEAVPCEAPPPKSGSPYREGSHWLSVIGTDGDRAIVHCENENKTWSVPYEIVDDEVVTKDPTEVQQTFEPVKEEDEDDEKLDSSDQD